MAELRIATRRSPLALAQSRWVAERLAEVAPGLQVRMVPVESAGDCDRLSPVAVLTEVGAFVRAVQEVVLAGEADLAVHSAKDLPVTGPGGLAVAWPARAAPWDVVVGCPLVSLDPGARVGTGSPRRAAQVAVLRPDLAIEEIRGNVDTRISKVDAGEYQALVLAEAGLARLGILDRLAQRLTLAEMVPAPGQGALAVEAAAGSSWSELAGLIDHHPTRLAVEAERALLSLTGAGCRSALGAYGESLPSGRLRLTGFVDDGSGPRRAAVESAGPEPASQALARSLGL